MPASTLRSSERDLFSGALDLYELVRDFFPLALDVFELTRGLFWQALGPNELARIPDMLALDLSLVARDLFSSERDSGSSERDIFSRARIFGTHACNNHPLARVFRMELPDYEGDQPGAAMAVLVGGKIVHRDCRGLADLESRTPVTPSTNFRLASVTKPFITQAIGILVERGLLRYGEVVFEGNTVRQLITHTSNLVDYEDLIPPDRTEQLTDDDVLRMLRTTDRTGFHYSNGAYVLLGLMIERVSGRPLEDFLRDEIFAKHRMHGTTLGPPSANRAYGYDRDGPVECGNASCRCHSWEPQTALNGKTAATGGGRLKTGPPASSPADRAASRRPPRERTAQARRPRVSRRDGGGPVLRRLPGVAALHTKHARWVRRDQSVTSATRGDGGMYSSIDDLARWCASLPHDATLGWFTGDGTIYHPGDTVSFRNAIVRWPSERLAVIVLTNRNEGDPLALAHRMRKEYYL